MNVEALVHRLYIYCFLHSETVPRNGKRSEKSLREVKDDELRNILINN